MCPRRHQLREPMQGYVQEFENGTPVLVPVEKFTKYLAKKVEEAKKHGEVISVAENSHISRDARGKPIIIYFYDIEITPSEDEK